MQFLPDPGFTLFAIAVCGVPFLLATILYCRQVTRQIAYCDRMQRDVHEIQRLLGLMRSE